MEKCLICFELTCDRFALPPLKTNNGDTLRAADCKHLICKTCMAAYITSRVEEHRVGDVRCPAEGCKNRIFEQDVVRFAAAGSLESSVRDRFAEFRAQNFAERSAEFSQMMCQELRSPEDCDLLLRIWRTTKLCPRCSLTFEKASGCDSFWCICGHHFNFASAPRAVGDGAKSFEAAVQRAKALGVSVFDALHLYMTLKDYHRSISLAEHLGISTSEAGELRRAARTGDESARETIRGTRRQTQVVDDGIETAAKGAIDMDLLTVVAGTELQSPEGTAHDSSKQAATTDVRETQEEAAQRSRQALEECETDDDKACALANMEEVNIAAVDGDDHCRQQSDAHQHTEVVWAAAGA